MLWSDLTWKALHLSCSVLTVQQFILFLIPYFLRLFLPPSTVSPGKEMWHRIYLCLRALFVVKSRRWTCLLGKSTDLLFTALRLLLLLLHQKRSMPFSLSYPSLLWTYTTIFVSGISGLAIDSNVTHESMSFCKYIQINPQFLSLSY